MISLEGVLYISYVSNQSQDNEGQVDPSQDRQMFLGGMFFLWRNTLGWGSVAGTKYWRKYSLSGILSHNMGYIIPRIQAGNDIDQNVGVCVCLFVRELQ